MSPPSTLQLRFFVPSAAQKAASEDQSVAVRFRSECHRTSRRIRTGGASVDLAYDDGRLVAQAHASRVRSCSRWPRAMCRP